MAKNYYCNVSNTKNCKSSYTCSGDNIPFKNNVKLQNTDIQKQNLIFNKNYNLRIHRTYKSFCIKRCI